MRYALKYLLEQQKYSNQDLEYCKSSPKNELIEKAEKELDIKFGPQLKKYLTTYGYIAHDGVELYGITSQQELNSDLVKQTKYIHKYFPKTKSLVAVENQGDGDYYLVDSKDSVYEFDLDRQSLINKHMKFFDYINERFGMNIFR